MCDSVYARVTRRLWLARGIVADSGLHVFGWSRAQLVEYLAVAGRISGAEADDYADRIAMLPGQLTLLRDNVQIYIKRGAQSHPVR